MPLNKQSLVSGSKKILGSSAGQLALVILIALFSYWFGSCQNNSSWESKYKTFWDSAQASATAYTDSINTVVDSLLEEKSELDQIARNLTTKNERLRRENVKLQDSLGAFSNIEPIAIDSLPPVCLGCIIRLDSAISGLRIAKILVETQQQQINNLEKLDSVRVSSIVFLTDALLIRKTESDSLKSIILNMPKPRSSRKFLFAFNLGPNESALLGAAAGLVVGVLISK